MDQTTPKDKLTKSTPLRDNQRKSPHRSLKYSKLTSHANILHIHPLLLITTLTPSDCQAYPRLHGA
ncbi:Hypothetical predicted protein, partial [Pelobates cultripes]